MLKKKIITAVCTCVLFLSSLPVSAAEPTNIAEKTPSYHSLKVLVEGEGLVDLSTDEEKISLMQEENIYQVKAGTEVETLLLPAETNYIRSVKLNETPVEVDDVNARFSMPDADAILVVTYEKISVNNEIPTARINQVTYNQTITNSFGHKTSKFQVNGIWAWCCDAHNTTPAKGDIISSIVESSNVNLRKVLWYGCLGPGAILANNNDGWMQTGQAASMAMGNGRVHSRYEAWYYDVIKKPAPPEGFRAYVATPANGKQLLTYFIYTPEEKGELTAKKVSANTAVTNGNSCYSLEGAQYGVYSNSNCTTKVGTLTFNASGTANTLELKAGTYYLKEIKAPKGYAISLETTKVTVTASKKTTATVSDFPQMNPVSVLLAKVDAETNQNKPQGTGALEGAQFTVKYYKGNYSSDPAKQGAIAARKWVFETDENGRCYFNEDYLVSGDAFYTTSDGRFALPLGTVTVQETKAPEGYHLNSELFVRQINASGNAEIVNTYAYPTVGEQILKLSLVKKQEGTNLVIPNVKFEHIRPDGSKTVLVTDANGCIIVKGLTCGQHSIQEIEMVDGYQLNTNKVIFNVGADHSITLQSEADVSKGEIRFEVNNAGNVEMTVYNKLAPYSLVVHKQNNKGLRLEGAEFTLYADPNCSNVLQVKTTDGNGELSFEGLTVGKKYYLKETKAPKGYRIPVDADGNPIVREIYATSVPINDEFYFYVDGSKFDASSNGNFTLTGTKENREVNVTVINEITYKLPDTGSGMTIVLLGVGMLLVVFGLKNKRAMHRKRENQ